ncbi:MAG: TIGR00282 family metallophosphoesterase [Thermoleophilia bacterium]
MRALMVGDVVGGVGLRALLEMLPALRDQHRPDLVVVNAENAADGTGTSARQAGELLDAGVDVLTGGNHSLKRTDFHAVLRDNPRVLRPANLPPAGAPGRGLTVVPTPAGDAAVINLQGAVFLNSTDNPFSVVDELVDRARAVARHVFLDFHSEATSEATAMGRHLDGRVTAVVGTHTHVQTADARVFPGGTAYMTDLGMTGPHDSVIGVRSDIIVRRFLGTDTTARFQVAEGEVLVQGALITADADGRATSIQAFSLPAPPTRDPA